MDRRQWKPIVSPQHSPEMYRQLKKKLDEIAAVLLKESLNMERIGLIQGKAGVALFFFYYAELSGKESHYDAGIQLVSTAIEAIGTHSQHTFGKGEPGIGWVVEHLAGNQFIDLDTNEILASVDGFIRKQMQKKLDEGVYDLLNGAIGDGMYALARSSKIAINEWISNLLAGLDNSAYRESSGEIAWKSVIYDLEHKPSGINLGLLYGVSGVVAYLSKLVKHDLHKEKALELLNGVVPFILKCAIPPGASDFCFPGWAGDSNNYSTCGLALGYGDLGVAVALNQAASAAESKQWQQVAVDTMLNATRFKDLQKYRVMDASLTSGTTGIAHVYNRIYQYTEDKTFCDASRYWLGETLKKADNPSGYAGFLAWRSKKSKHKDKDFALLEGIAGIGLALISALSPVQPDWDECFLLS